MNDPKRLLDDTPGGDLGRLLSAGKSDMPGDAQLAGLAAKLGILGGVGAAGAAGLGGAGGGAAGGGASAAGGTGVAVTAAKTGLALKIGGVVAIASATVVSAAVVTTSRHEAPQAPVGIVATVVTSSVTPAETKSNGSLAITPLPSIEPSASAPTTRTVAKSTSSASGGAESEVRQLERAQDALRSNPAQALALADEHARQFPQGMLAQEREVIAIEALAKMGRTSEARARAARFKTRFPGSSHTRRIDALLGD